MLFNSILTIILHITIAFAVPHKRSKKNNDPAKKYLVKSLPGMSSLPKDYAKPIMYAGELELYSQNKSDYFFWKFIDSTKTEKSKNITTFWLNGGPGCSSMDGVLLENGPYRVNKLRKLEVNNGSWHKISDMVYVDQPVGTGFSFTSKNHYVHELDQIGQYFLKFLEKYFEIFPQDLKNDLYLSGESYAGQYIPYIASYILNRNENLPNGEKPYNLKSIMIGNGWVSPDEQSLSYLPFFESKKLINIKDQSSNKTQLVTEDYENCKKLISQESNENDNEFDSDNDITTIGDESNDVCNYLLNDLLYLTANSSAPKSEQCINVYDYTLRDSYPACGSNFPPELKYTTPYLRQKSVLLKLHIHNAQKWQECSDTVYSELTAENSLPSVYLLPELIKKIPIVLFNGANDIICNTQGVLNYLQKMEWEGRTGFSNVNNTSPWLVGSKKAGWVIQERNLTFVNVYNASHMVPYSQPLISRSLFDFVLNTYSKKKIDGKISYVSTPL
ncbi:KEX1 [Candida jiufengensis]|uniref:KEX1 n=1 Tax=Candida jiufengensis TaxID=497108 RepID=UPI002224A58C|nr:KEX1 [Candida jiufengensis]KAI5949624.1 KEX1 [Candida jiufengensis]